MKNKKVKNIVLLILGVISIIGAFFCYSQDMVAIGGGLSGFGTVSLVFNLIALLSKPEAQKANEIEEKDERNVAIRGKAAYASNMVMLGCFAIAGIFYLHIGQIVTGIVFATLLFILLLSNLIATAVYRRKM